jgi:thiosulfate dehydrogenase
MRPRLILAIGFVVALTGLADAQPADWAVPNLGTLPRDAHGLQVRRGRDLIVHSYAYVGPGVADKTKRYAGNNLACSNCHLEAGTRKFGLPLFGLFGDFPQYSARSGRDISIEDRINSCFTRSMNGRAMPADAPEMQAIVSYIKFISAGVAPGQKLPGLGSGHMAELDRAADPKRGADIYVRRCAACHNTDGSGIARSRTDPALGYMIPPLWGRGSYNNGAGMARLGTFANFIHFNMPHGADYLDPELTPEESWDIAAYVLSQPRPKKAGLDKDFPDLLLKPLDAPFPPYADGFSETQHRYGPFGPIRGAIEKLREHKQN